MKKHLITVASVTMAAILGSPAQGADLREAIAYALQTSPEIRQAVHNREATMYERKQAEGLYFPRISVEASAGIRELRNPTRRSLGIADDTLYPRDVALTVDQLLFDSGAREAEIRHQEARTDAAAARIEERSEFIALNISRAYIDYLLQQRLVAIAQDNALFHQGLVDDLQAGVDAGSISIADLQQSQERLQSAQARVVEAQEELDLAAISFERLAGMPIGNVAMPPDLSNAMPESLGAAIELARMDNPLVEEAVADYAAARELIKKAKGEMGPRFNLEGRARYGEDIDGFDGITEDYQARGVVRWDVFTGGTNAYNVREQQSRADEVHARLFEKQRDAEELARAAWSRLANQGRLAEELAEQSRITDELLLSYREQFNVGRRSLLDVLDAQNTRYNVQAQLETAQLAQLYAQYRVLAAVNRLVEAMGVDMARPAYQADRDLYWTNTVPASDRAEDSLRYPVMGPPVAEE
ncbi:TolC family protein [Sphingomicrobium astaxanthinifaciens]|uniref:TolC family protein n=1 Tax=Sphingomicrobium astaxanthinifaciens TaxID=1227949 RepID=UPI001FCADB07|nr:TolC family protein [Sphingomicrobium astaxanthinifaciens]MCJ7420932.1 TolC family protein [Sphingomicrobium astaxanthinifaciens]